jgi:hypothetical protein
LQADTNAVNGAIIDQALSEARDALFHAGTPEVSMVDALVEVCRRALDRATGASRQDRFRTYVHLDTDGRPGTAHAWFNGGPQLPAALRDLLLCDGTVRPLWLTDGKPVNVGRAQRIVPEHARRLVLDRDRSCRHPARTATRHLEVHHLQHWLHGGTTDLTNLLALCPKHHDAHHRGVFTMTGNPDEPGGLQFHDHRGRAIAPCGTPTLPTGPPPAPPPGHRYRHPTGETFHTKWFHLTEPPRVPSSA